MHSEFFNKHAHHLTYSFSNEKKIQTARLFALLRLLESSVFQRKKNECRGLTKNLPIVFKTGTEITRRRHFKFIPK